MDTGTRRYGLAADGAEVPLPEPASLQVELDANLEDGTPGWIKINPDQLITLAGWLRRKSPAGQLHLRLSDDPVGYPPAFRRTSRTCSWTQIP